MCVSHLPQLLVEGGGPGLCCCVADRTEHPPVPVNEVAVSQPDHLHTEGGRETQFSVAVRDCHMLFLQFQTIFALSFRSVWVTSLVSQFSVSVSTLVHLTGG